MRAKRASDAQRADLDRPSAPRSCWTTKTSSQLARWACAIEEHYGRPMDMEWAKDGETGELFIVQARPEDGAIPQRSKYIANLPDQIERAGSSLSGLSIGEAVVAGRVCLIESPKDIGRFVDGAILVTDATDPGLGADHEARRSDRHRSRRPHLARGHRQPRIGLAGGRRNRRCDARSSTTSRKSPCPAPRGRGLHL